MLFNVIFFCNLLCSAFSKNLLYLMNNDSTVSYIQFPQTNLINKVPMSYPSSGLHVMNLIQKII